MKLSFEGNTFADIIDQMKIILERVSEYPKNTAIPKTASGAKSQGPGPEAIATGPEAIVPKDNVPVDKPVDKPKVDKVAAMNKARAAKAAKAAAAKPEAVPEQPVDKPALQPLDPAEAAKIRQKTIEDLQQAYANGHQAEVFELLSRFGNGAKSFRELPPEAFQPIREAIDMGALT